MTDIPPSTETEKRRSADYANPQWKHVLEVDDKYDQKRFQSSAKARKRHLRDQQMLVSFLQTLPSGQKVLDAPSGMGRFVETISQHGHSVVAMEVNFGRTLDAYLRSSGQTPAVQADVFHLPCKDQAFDAAVCFRLLHHLEAEMVRQVLKELRRVARRAFVTFYNKNTYQYYRQRLEGKTPHRKFYSKTRIEQWCRETGWTVEQIRPVVGFFQNIHAVWLI